MLKNECFSYFIDINKNKKRPNRKNLRILSDPLYTEFIIYINTNYWTNSLIESGKVYCFLNDIESPPICTECGELTKFKQFSFGFFRFCSSKCSSINSDTRKKCENTCLEKYGHKNIAHGVYKTKIKETLNLKYGGHQSRTKEFWDKKNNTEISKYGTIFFKSDAYKEMYKKTCIDKYGVDNPMKDPDIFNKSLRTKYINGVCTDWNNNEDISKSLFDYRKDVKYKTEINFRKYYYIINPDLHKRNVRGWQLDHIYPIIEGWKNKIPADMIANHKNLQMLWYSENQSKLGKCDMSVDDFYKIIKE